MNRQFIRDHKDIERASVVRRDTCPKGHLSENSFRTSDTLWFLWDTCPKMIFGQVTRYNFYGTLVRKWFLDKWPTKILMGHMSETGFWDYHFFDENSQKVKIFEKKLRRFFFGIDSDCFKTYLKPKTWFRKFPVENFFLGLNHFLTKIVKKWKFSKKIEKIFFWNRFTIF